MNTLFSLHKNVVFPGQAERSYFSTHFRLTIFLHHARLIMYDISILECMGVSVTVCAGFFRCDGSFCCLEKGFEEILDC